MKSIRDISLFTGILLTIFTSIISAQESDEKYLKNLEALKSGTSERDDMVLNPHMIEKFYNAYDHVEVLPWDQLLSQKNFDDVKLYLNAYHSLSKEELNKGNLAGIIESKVLEAKNELREGLTKSYPVAENKDQDYQTLPNKL